RGSCRLAQHLEFFESLRHVAQDRRHSDQVAFAIAIWPDRKLDRDARSVFTYRWHRQDIALSVPRLSGAYRFGIGIPVSLTESSRNNDIERFSARLSCGVSKNPLGSAIPEPDHAAAISVNDRIWPIMDERPTEPVGIESYCPRK